MTSEINVATILIADYAWWLCVKGFFVHIFLCSKNAEATAFIDLYICATGNPAPTKRTVTRVPGDCG